MILAHGLFKATLFMLVGVIDHQAHTRDLRVLSGLGKQFPAMFGIAAVAVASMAGLPPLLGFATKEAALEALLHDGGPVVAGGIVLGSILTFAYGARFLWGAFGRKDPEVTPIAGIKAPARAFLAPALALAVLTVVLGLVPDTAGRLVAGAAGSLDAGAGGGHLYLWHGLSPALGLSALTVIAGGLMFRYRRKVELAQAKARVGLSAEAGYQHLVRGLNRSADRVTGFVQNGSLPVYIAVILLTAVSLPGWALVRGGTMPGDLRFAESPLQAAVAGAVLVAAVFMVRVRQRLNAVLLLGAVGFGVAVLFVIQGAPDLALTQLLIETLALVIFVLVLRHLPPWFKPVRWRVGNALRLGVSICVGVFVAGFALLAANPGGQGHISREYLERALPEGGGRNVVNVILTDFRGLDTLGEITVLTVAAFGIASLVMVGRRDEEESDEV
jgi:multicomponent Na+:H+ antiporter subunit A